MDVDGTGHMENHVFSGVPRVGSRKPRRGG